MGRKKVNLEFIADEKRRRTIFHNRVKGLKKKIYELSILSDVKACSIIYGPGRGRNTEHPVQPDIWPENQNHVCEILNQFLKYDVKERGKREMGIQELFKNQTKKVQAELDRLRRQNDQIKNPTWGIQLDHFSLEQLGNLSNQLDLKIELVKQKLLDRTDQQSLCAVKPLNQCFPIEGTVSDQLDLKLDEHVKQILFDRTEGHFSAPPNDVHQQPLSYGKPLNQCFPSNQLDSKLELMKQILFDDDSEGEQLDFLEEAIKEQLVFFEEAIGYFSTPSNDMHQKPLSYGKSLNQYFPIDGTSVLDSVDCANFCTGPIGTDLPYTYAPSMDKFHHNSFMLPTMNHEFGFKNSGQDSPGYFIPANNQQMPWFFQNPPQFYDSMGSSITAAAESSHEILFNNSSCQGGGSFFLDPSQSYDSMGFIAPESSHDNSSMFQQQAIDIDIEALFKF
ncbi:hypothetical protein NE237_025122 [Protea cynaroides]|uniref:MADS-box domain-containing protein n=1 Tax=Protea cynaroides TaxID=273540 RepID=A0A9Q0H1A0_9MAGN|nr:hypothetical protein NE237_025122 [Protea cynaroides]